MRYVDFVYPYLVDTFAFVTKVPRRLPFKKAITQPFRFEVWLCILASLATTSLVLGLLWRWTPRRFLVGQPPDFWLLLATLTHQSGWRSAYKTTSFRFLLGSWLLLTTVTANAYSCLLLSLLNVPEYDEQIDTVPQLERAIRAGKVAAGTANGTAQARFIMSSTAGTLNLIRQQVEKNPDLLVERKTLGLQKAAKESYSYIDTRLGLRGALAEMNVSTLKVSTGDFGTTFFSLALQKTCFYGEIFSRKSRHLVETGHFLKWERDDTFRYSAKKQEVASRDASTFDVLDLSDMFGATMILLCGVALSTCMLALELLFVRPAH
ncbi:glutamate receptor ionotropic, delta-1-like [Ornithodoros turicata]|uniref:glutamate receptor ionotropic, delta-1-like n=1 Tax=Ornithodoros turicata TaxID=34597 RepID=UPI003138706C